MNWNGVTDCLESFAARYHIPGWSVTVWQEHQELYQMTGGTSDFSNRRPVTDKDLYWLYSLSKLSTCTAATRLVEQGALRLDAPVAEYLPAFANQQVLDHGSLRPPKRAMTILDLFTMRGGLNYNLDGLIPACGSTANTQTIVAKIAQRPLDFDPGERFQYSLCHDVLAAVVEKVSGKRFSEYLRDELFLPLGMTETDFRARETDECKLSAQYMYDDGKFKHMSADNNYQLTPNYDSGGAGLCSTLRDYIKLVDALANGGVGRNGTRVLSEDGVRAMALNRLDAEQTAALCAWRPGYGYGLGVRTRLAGPDNPHAHTEFGWDGAAGAYALCDTGSRLAVLYMQHVRSCGPAYDVLHPALRDAVYAAMGL